MAIVAAGGAVDSEGAERRQRRDGFDLGRRPALGAPNDLCFGRRGNLGFTYPCEFNPEEPADGYIYSIAADGSCDFVEEVGPVFPNGIIALPDHFIVWGESYTRRVCRRDRDGRVAEIARLPVGHMPDGLKAGDNGCLFIASIMSGGIDIVSLRNGEREFLRTGGRPLNCLFVDESLYVADDGIESGPRRPYRAIAAGGSRRWRNAAVYRIFASDCVTTSCKREQYPMDLGLQGKRAWILGASGGLGLAIATELSAQGARVAISSRSMERLSRAAENIAATPVPLDVSGGSGAVESACAEVSDALSGLDIVVVNHGGPHPGGFDAVDDIQFAAAYELVLASAFRVTKASVPHLRRAGGGVIVYITSATTKEIIPDLFLSNTMRAGVVGMMKTFSHQLAADSIRLLVRRRGAFPLIAPPAWTLQSPAGKDGRSRRSGVRPR